MSSQVYVVRVFRPKTLPRRVQDALKTYPRRLFDLDTIFMRFGVDFGAFLGGKWLPKCGQNSNKSRKKRFPARLRFYIEFLGNFHWFLLPTSTPRTSKIKPPLQGEHDFSKNRFSHLASIFDGFWYHLGSIFPPKMEGKSTKNWKSECQKGV